MASHSEFDIFDRNPDSALDELTQLAAVLGDADYAYIGWMDPQHLWFKSRHGFAASNQPRAASACQWVLDKGGPLLIADASEDARFPPEGIPLTGAQSCRSYAGMPLVTGSGQVIGALAILSAAPRQFTTDHLALLEIVGRQAATRLELYRSIRAQELAQRACQRTERALAIERGFVAATLDSIPALVAVLDTAGRIVRFNQPCAQLTGFSLAEAAGHPFVAQILEDVDRDWAAERLQEAARGQASDAHETSWRVKGGLPRRVRWTLRPLPGPNGEIQYLIVSGQDVTDQRQAEQALHSSETHFREVVEGSLGFVFTCTMEGRLTSLNAFTAETLGYPVEDLTGRALTDLLDPAGADVFQDGLRALQTQNEWQGSLSLRRSDGVCRRIAFRSRRMELAGTQPFVLHHGIDVTEQHDAEEALHLATRHRESILESVGDGIIGIDLEGRITFINQAAARALGYASGQLTGIDIHDAVHRSHADGTLYSRATDPILKAMHSGETVRMTDELFWRKDGSAIPVEYSVTPLVEGGRLSGMVVAFQDVSERRRLEKMKDEFISTVSHELRTPLTSLRASLGLISSGSLDKRPEKQRQMIEMAIGNCDRLVRLVNDIVDFDSFRKGRMPLHRQPVEAVDMLRRAADVAHAAAAQNHVSLRIDAPKALVMADEERILQVLNELVANALKFSPAETTIRLSAKASGATLFSQSPADADEFCLAVEDQGRGIAPETLERIFDRFEQGDASDARALGGTGLGLALCRSIVEQHGGRIWAESAVGQGSRFLFTLPAAAGN